MQLQLNAYKTIQASAETPVSTLISALNCLESNIIKTNEGDVAPEQVELRSHSIEIIGLLLASLDFEVNRTVADSLASLYLFINSKMVDYSTSKADLKACSDIISTVKTAFVEADAMS